MAIRTTSDAVKLIVETADDISTDLAPFIEVASKLVDVHVEPVTLGDAAELELVERWLAAHFYAVRDLRVDMESAGSVSEKKQFKVDLALLVTIYGQQAIVIDSSGALAALSKKSVDGTQRKVSATWLGTPHC